MKLIVVFFTLASVACASWAPAIVAPHVHTVAVAPVVVTVPAAVSHQSRVDVRHSPAIVSHAIAPAYGYASLGYGGYGHNLQKRSLGHATPALVAHSAVSHQSRVDVVSRPAVISHTVAAPVVAHAAPVVAAAPAAVSHQSRVDVISRPAVVSHAVAAPVVAHAAPVVAVAPAGVLHQARLDVHARPDIAIGTIGYAAPYNYGYNGYYNSAPLVHAW